jgi:hypothetical protein
MTNLIRRELSDCLSDKIGFSMRGRIVIGVYGIHSGENDVAVQDKESAEWMITIGPCLASK